MSASGEIPIPGSYQEWRAMLEQNVGATIDTAFLEERLKALRDPADKSTETFAKVYGKDHLERVIGWYEQAKEELAQQNEPGPNGSEG